MWSIDVAGVFIVTLILTCLFPPVHLITYVKEQTSLIIPTKGPSNMFKSGRMTDSFLLAGRGFMSEKTLPSIGLVCLEPHYLTDLPSYVW